MKELEKQDCVLTPAGGKRLEGAALRELHSRLDSEWQMTGESRLRKSFAFDDFASALAYVNRVGAMADQQNHHPNVQLSWGCVVLEIWTHTVRGLTEADFVFAAKAQALR